MRKIGHKIAKPFFCIFLHTPDFAVFAWPFHGVFTGFSWPFHGFFSVTIFVNLEVAPYFLHIFGGGTLLG
jgi:hypothetical protein